MTQDVKLILDELIDTLELLCDAHGDQPAAIPETHIDEYYQSLNLASTLDSRIEYTSETRIGFHFLIESCSFGSALSAGRELRNEVFGERRRLGTDKFRLDDDTVIT